MARDEMAPVFSPKSGRSLAVRGPLSSSRSRGTCSSCPVPQNALAASTAGRARTLRRLTAIAVAAVRGLFFFKYGNRPMIFRTLAAVARRIFSPTVRDGPMPSEAHPLPEHVRAAIEKLPEPLRAATTSMITSAFAAGIAEGREPTRVTKFFQHIISAWASARREACSVYQRKLNELADAARNTGAVAERQRIAAIMDTSAARLEPGLAWSLVKAGLAQEEVEAALRAASCPPPGVEPRAELTPTFH
jgi:hypothetical protein